MSSDREISAILSGIRMAPAVTAFIRPEFVRYLLRCRADAREDPRMSAICLSPGDGTVGCEWMPADASDRVRMAKRWYRSMLDGRYESVLFETGRDGGTSWESEFASWSAIDGSDVTYLAGELAAMARSVEPRFEPVCLVLHRGQYDRHGAGWSIRRPHWHMVLKAAD